MFCNMLSKVVRLYPDGITTIETHSSSDRDVLPINSSPYDLTGDEMNSTTPAFIAKWSFYSDYKK